MLLRKDFLCFLVVWLIGVLICARLPAQEVQSDSPAAGRLCYRRPGPLPSGVPSLIVVEPISSTLRQEYDLPPFYKKVAIIDGLLIIGSEKVSDYAFLEACWIIDHMLRGCDRVKQALIAAKARIGIMAVNEFTMDIPENQVPWMQERGAYHDRRSRGLGGLPLTTCGEENLLDLRGDPYWDENILIHEFAHTIAFALERVDKAWWEQLNRLYQQAREEGLWARTYAAVSAQEYWAEGVQAWFDCNSPAQDNGIHNGMWNRERLKGYDPRLAEFIRQTLGDSPWRYTKPRNRSPQDLEHLAGLNRESMPRFSFDNSPRIQAEKARTAAQQRSTASPPQTAGPDQ